MAKTQRISMTVDSKLLDDLNFLSSVLLVSRSSLITELLSPTCEQMRGIIELTNSATSDSPDSAILARDPAKVRLYIDGLTKAISDQKSLYDDKVNVLLSTMDGQTHEH
jgi:hypothetical protein